jgi:AcrR family transcriptional regulator
VVQARIVDGAVTALAAGGFDATIEDIAAAAGVSRRTVFRHFATHNEVLAAAMSEMLARYDDLVPGPPAADTDLEAWLEKTAATLHELNARLMGRAFWDMHVDRPGVSPAVREARRMGHFTQISHYAWRAANGKGDPPDWVVDAFELQLSGFATNCLAHHSAERAGQVSAFILGAVLSAALADEQ